MKRFSLPYLPAFLTALLVVMTGCGAADPNIAGAERELRAGDYARVIELTDAAIADNPDNAQAHFLRGEAFRLQAHQQTDPAARERSFENMAQAYERARTLEPGNQIFQLNLMQAYGEEMNRGAEAFRAGAEDDAQYHRAADAFATAGRIMPDSADAPLNRGFSLLAAGEIEAAADPLQRAINLNADSPDAYLYLGRIYLSQDRADDAIVVLEQARERYPEDEEIGTELLNTYARTGQIDRALDAYAASVAENPDDAVLRYNYGSFLLQAERYDEAVQHLERATQLAPEDPNAYYNLGAAYINQAVEVNQRLADLDTNDPQFQTLEQRRNTYLRHSVEPLERARQLLAAEGEDVTEVCQSLFRAYAQLRMNEEAQAAAECAGIDLN